MRLSGTAPSEGITSGYASTIGGAQPAAAAPVSHEKSNSLGSLALNDITSEESKPLVVSSRNQPYLDYGATGMPALRIENLSKVSLGIN